MADSYAAIAPNPAALSQYTTPYASYLASSSGENPTMDWANHAELKAKAAAESGTYLNLFKQAQATNSQLAQEGMYNERQKSALEALGQVNRGSANVNSLIEPYLTTNDPHTGQPVMDPATASAFAASTDNSGRDAQLAHAQQDRSLGAKNLADSGFSFSPSDLSSYIAAPGDTKPLPIIGNYITPENKARLETADAAGKSADARMVSAKKGHGAGDGNFSVSVTPNPYGGASMLTEHAKGARGAALLATEQAKNAALLAALKQHNVPAPNGFQAKGGIVQ